MRVPGCGQALCGRQPGSLPIRWDMSPFLVQKRRRGATILTGMLKAFSYLSRLVAPVHPAPQPRTDCLSSSGPSTWTPDLCPLWLLDSYLSFKVQLSGPLLPEVRVGTEDTVANKTDRMLPFCHPLT